MKSIVILGGTGYTGKLITCHLKELLDTRVTVAARRLEKSQAIVDDGALCRTYPPDGG